MPNYDKSTAFDKLVSEVKGCRKCPRMDSSERVLGRSCGSLDAKVMFVGEAPGRLGADTFQIPFHGDKAGSNFESLIEQVGLNRYETFITNAVLCNPKDADGNNSTPTRQEIDNCSGFLRRQIDLIGPKIVVTLGAVALKAAACVDGHDLDLSQSVRVSHSWYARKLIPAYHPGQRAMIHRSFANQLADYRFVADHLRAIDGGRPKRIYGATAPRVAAVANRITELRPRLTYFALHKLFFLVETEAVRRLGRRITSGYIVRQKDGPYCVDLHPSKLLKAIPYLTLKRRGTKIYLVREEPGLFGVPGNTFTNSNAILDEPELNLIGSVVERYGSLSDAELKRRAYLAKDMRKILRLERTERVSMFNSPLLVPNLTQTKAAPT